MTKKEEALGKQTREAHFYLLPCNLGACTVYRPGLNNMFT